MKKIYFLFTFLISVVSFGQSPIITAIVDGDCTGGTPKLLEIYADGAVNFALYSLQNQTNATTGAFGAPVDLSVLGTVTDDFVYVTTSSDFTILSAEFPSVTFVENTNTLVSSVMNLNGDDRIRIIETASTTVIDQFGVTDVDGTGSSWETLDSFAKRLDGTGPDGGFIEANWNIPGVSTLDGGGTCQGGSTFESMMGGIGTYTTTASTSPTINVSGPVTGLDYFEGNGPSPEGTFTVSGLNLTANITVTAPTDFEISLTSGNNYGTSVNVTQTGGTAPTTTIYARLAAGRSVNSYTGDATAASTGATSETVSLSGTVSPAVPQITINGSVESLDYTLNNGPSAEDSFSVEGLFLTTDLTVTAPTNFEVATTSGGSFGTSVSFTPDGGGTVSASDVFIRLAGGLGVGPYSGDVTASSTGATNQTLTVSGNVFGAATNALVITGVYDGPLPGGNPKGVELYVLADIADLSLFGIGSANNGGGSDGQEYTFPADAVTAGTFIYVASEATEFANFFGFAPTYNAGSTMGINGDDAVELFENGGVIDTYGDINTLGDGEVWDYTDGWAYRVNDSGPDGSTFVPGNWTYSGIDQLEGGLINADCTSPFPLGTYMNSLGVSQYETSTFSVYPNPVSNGFVNITSANAGNMNISVFDVLGKQVLNQTVNNNRLNVSTLNSGVYIMKISQNGTSSTKKLVIK